MATPSTSQAAPVTLTDRARRTFAGVLNWAAGLFLRLGIHPNVMTLTGVLGNFVAAYFLAQGNWRIGGGLVIVMGAFDALDGAMARLRGESSAWGAFVDSVSDRYSELAIFFGLLWHYAQTNDGLGVTLAYLAAAGSVLVSYVRARAASLGWDVKVGVLSRFERYLVLAPTLALGLPKLGMAIVAVGAHFTALQRIAYMRRMVRQHPPQGELR
ncbi:MAG: CDP-alcohol phosphatidyltransferase family protein [Chloroflexi bacterium]|nr:CDP-alcohol phosphatidyltransferase family protein [Chloroflexota bacterium]